MEARRSALTVSTPFLAFAAVLLASASIAAPAAAQGDVAGAEGDREAERTALYREATEAAGAGRWGEAKERLRAALALRSSPKVLFSMAQVEEQLGQLASAQADYARSIEGAATIGESDVVHAAEQALRALSPQVPHVRVRLSGAEPARSAVGASAVTAMLDDRPIAPDTAVAADPGEHRLVVSAPGMQLVTANLTVSKGQQLDVPVRLEPEHGTLPPVSPSPPSAAPSPPDLPGAVLVDRPAGGASAWRTVGLITAGAGVVALGVGAVFGVEAISKHADAHRACPDVTCPDANGATLWHDAVTAGTVSTVAFVVGGVALIGGAILWFAAPGSSDAGPKVGFGPGSMQFRGAW